MEYIYAAMVLHKAGKEVNEAAVTKVLESAGVQVDTSRVKALVSALEGVDIDQAIKESAIVVPAAIQASPSSGEAPAEGEKKEAKKEEDKTSTEEAAAGLGSLFG